MIANALRAEIDAYAARMRRLNPMFVKAQDGSFTRQHLTTYLRSVHGLVSHTPVYLRRAKDRASALGDTRLAAHYEAKWREEQGHDEWAKNDIASVSSITAASRAELASSMTAMLEYLERTIDRDPALYLAYILFAEYLTVLLGDEWLGLLDANCGIPRASMSVVGNHVDLDREHVEHALDEIDDLVSDPRKVVDMRAVLFETFELFDRFCAEVTSSAPRMTTNVEAQISAA